MEPHKDPVNRLPARDEFAAHLNSTFTLQSEPHGALSLALEQVSELRETPAQRIFTILFRGPNEPLLPQGTYVFQHEQLGEMALFIVPVGRDETGTRYEAVFNQLVKK